MTDIGEARAAAPPTARRPRLPRALPRSRAALTDLLIVCILAIGNAAVITAIGAVPEEENLQVGDPALSYLGGLACALLLLGRRRAPLTVFTVLTFGALAAQEAGLFVWVAAGPGLGFAAYSIGRHRRLRNALLALYCAIAVTLVSEWISFDLTIAAGWFFVAYTLAVVIGAWWAGRLVRARDSHVVELQARAERLERARDAHGRAVLAEERSRIARELHDVVAHHVSVMTVQATAGRRVLDRDPERARQALTDIEQTGRQALAEMRRIVGVLRTDTGEGATRAPQPGLAALGELIEQVRDAGMAVGLRREGGAVPLPPGLDLTLYRVVQEALTNVFKHAGEGAAAEVTVRYAHRRVEVAVEDDGAGPGARTAGDEPGHGLLGMRERVALFGGELDAGPRGAGGFAVRARVPVELGIGGAAR